MVTTVSNMQSFGDELTRAGSKLVVVDYYADWCGPCRAIAPLVNELASQFSATTSFLKVNVDQARDIAAHNAIRSMPTFQFYQNSKLVDQFSGADPNKLRSTVERLAPAATFGGEGVTLGGGAPKIDWGETKPSKEELAAAAASRFEAAKPTPVATAEPAEPKQAEVTAQPVAQAEPASTLPGLDDSTGLPKVDENKRALLEEMGFPRNRAEKALILTSNGSVEQAADWIFNHMDDADIDEPLQIVHKPTLTPEEKKAKADALLASARAKRAEDEKKREIEREKERMRTGKEITTAKSNYDEEQRRRDVMARKKEKADLAAEKVRLRKLLEEDKKQRAEKYAKEHVPVVQDSAPAVVEKPHALSSKSAGTIDLRFPDGSRLQSNFEAEQTLKDVARFVITERSDIGSFALQSSYPRKTFSPAEFEKTTLGVAGLVPRGALTVVPL